MELNLEKYISIFGGMGDKYEKIFTIENSTLDFHYTHFSIKTLHKDYEENQKLVNGRIREIVREMSNKFDFQSPLIYTYPFDEENEKIDFKNKYYRHQCIFSEDFYISLDSCRSIDISTLSEKRLDEIVGYFSDVIEPYKSGMDLKYMNFVTIYNNELALNPIEIDEIEVDIDNYYDGLDYDSLKTSLESEKSGIVLMHSEAGCGKTSLIRYLNQEIDKRFIVLNPSTINLLENPSSKNFILNEFKDAIIIIEDGEKALADRNSMGGTFSSVSTLLNLSDGIEGAALGCKVIVTYNNSENIDPAFLRSGRLLHSVELSKLPLEKVKKVAEKLGQDSSVYTTPVPLCDIFNTPVKINKPATKKVGFINS